MPLYKIILIFLLTHQPGNPSIMDSKEMRKEFLHKVKFTRREAFYPTPPFEMNTIKTNHQIDKSTLELYDAGKINQVSDDTETTRETEIDYENVDRNDTNNSESEYNDYLGFNYMMDVLAKQNELVGKLVAQYHSESNKEQSPTRNAIDVLRRSNLPLKDEKVDDSACVSTDIKCIRHD